MKQTGRFGCLLVICSTCFIARAAESPLPQAAPAAVIDAQTAERYHTDGLRCANAQDFPRARALLEKCVLGLSGPPVSDPGALAHALTNLGGVEAAMGWHSHALPRYRQALKLLAARPETVDRLMLEATCHDGIGAALSSLGRYHEAYPPLLKAAETWDVALDTLAKDDARRTDVLAGFYRARFALIVVCLSEGRQEIVSRNVAIPVQYYCEQTKDKAVRRLGDSHPLLVDVYSTAAELHLRFEELSKAAEYAEKALKIAKQHDNRSGVLEAKHLVAMIAYRRGELERAAAGWTELLGAYQASGDLAGCARTQLYLGEIRLKQNKPDLAADHFRQAESLLDRLGCWPASRFQAKLGLAKSLVATGDADGAIARLKDALEVVVVAGASTTGGRAHWARFHGCFADGHDLLLDLLCRRGEYVEALYYADEFRKRILTATLRLDEPHEAQDERSVELRAELDELLQRRQKLLGELQTSGETEAAFAQRKSLEAQVYAVLRKMDDNNRRLRQLLGEVASLDDFRARLNDFQRTLRSRRDAVLYYCLGDDESHLFIIHGWGIAHHPLAIHPRHLGTLFTNPVHDAAPVAVTRACVKRMVQEYLFLLRRRCGPFRPRIADELEAAEKVLKRKTEVRLSGETWVWREFNDPQALAMTETLLPRSIREPLERSGFIRHAILVPDGALHRLSFPALPVAVVRGAEKSDVEADYLIDEGFPPIVVTPSLGAFAASLQPGAQPRLRATVLLAGPGANSRLPGAVRETLKVARLFPNQAVLIEAGKNGGMKRLLLELPRARIVSFHTHGVAYRSEHNNAFAHIVIPGQKGQPDERLEAHQVPNLPLDGCNLVALVACETAVASEGYLEAGISLVSGMQAAGAQTVAATYWRVNVTAAETLTTVFYRHVAKMASGGRPVDYAEAAHKAMQEVKKEYPAPYYWAPLGIFGAPKSRWGAVAPPVRVAVPAAVAPAVSE